MMIDTPKLKFKLPEDAVYRPGEPGVLTRDSLARQCITARELEWGGNWGDIHADPAEEYLQHGYLAYRHIEPNEHLRERLNRHMPNGW